MKPPTTLPSSSFRAVEFAYQAQSLTDGVSLKLPVQEQSSLQMDDSQVNQQVIMPWVGYGTYRLGKDKAYEPTLQAIKEGYRCIDTAFIYAAEHTEKQVGQAIQTAMDNNIIKDRKDIFVISKHWRKYHGYEQTLDCLNLSLKRLCLDYIDLYLIHWPGPAYEAMIRNKQVLVEQGPWAYAAIPSNEMAHVRAETWRAMEDAMTVHGTVRAIGVSNFTIGHLKTLQQTARIWPPAVNQVECHPLYPNNQLREYCQKEGIVLQAYAALGGQDATKQNWKQLLDGSTLITCPTVLQICSELNQSGFEGDHEIITPAQVLLRFALQRNCAVTPKTRCAARMKQNANIFHFELSTQQMKRLDELQAPGDAGRLCWRTDPLRMLDFE